MRGEGLSLLASGAKLTDVERRLGRFGKETASFLAGFGRLAGGSPRGAGGIGGIAAGIGGIGGGISGTSIPRSIICLLRQSGRMSQCWVWPPWDPKWKSQ